MFPPRPYGHGSAPDCGQESPSIGQIWSGAMMLRHFGAAEARTGVEHAIAAIWPTAKVSHAAISEGGHQRTNWRSRSQAGQRKF